MDKELYMLEMPYHLSSYHKWAENVYEYASRYNKFLFDQADILLLADELELYAKDMRNFDGIYRPLFTKDMVTGPFIGVGHDFSIHFTKIEGRYGDE